jgi:hypothetical protein
MQVAILALTLILVVLTFHNMYAPSAVMSSPSSPSSPPSFTPSPTETVTEGFEEVGRRRGG